MGALRRPAIAAVGVESMVVCVVADAAEPELLCAVPPHRLLPSQAYEPLCAQGA